MACYHPLPAWQLKWGGVSLKEVSDGSPLRLPCGGCIGCRTAYAKSWALRCSLELQQHARAGWTTLTYDEKHVPVTLSKRDLQLYIKKLRKKLGPKRPIRFFASGEYGETNKRPHFHGIFYGLDERDRDLLHDTWGAGYTKTVPLTPQAISYTAGYTSKKIGFKLDAVHERIDYETGEIYRWEPPFIQMSRRPGIGSHARQWLCSWRLYAVHNGQRMPVPRYLHQAWKDHASPLEMEELLFEKYLLTAAKDTSTEKLQAAEKIAISKQSLLSLKRAL